MHASLRVPLAVLVTLLVGASGCRVIHEGEGTESPGAQAEPIHDSPSVRPGMVEPSGHVYSAEGQRTDLIPVGYSTGHLNTLTGLRTDPTGSREGQVATADVGLLSAATTAAPTTVPTDAAAFGMWGAGGPGGMAGGSALLREAPITSHPGETAQVEAVKSRSKAH